MDEDAIFLTNSQATNAICIDFQQHAPQFMLFSEIVRLISNDTVHLQRDPHKDGAWINNRGTTKMKWLTGKALIQFMCRAIQQVQWHPQLLAEVCGRVFQTKVVPAVAPNTGASGVSIGTNMKGYACRQCGRCCRILDYHNEVTAEDVARWKALGREDIIHWVRTEKNKDQGEIYRVWIDPETGGLASPCPFLKKDPARNRWECLIHDVKPEICRQYPITRKHAVMTGCKGFADH